MRLYQQKDKEALLDIFKRNVPKYFDPKEILDFKEYLEQQGGTYYVLEIDHKIAGGVGYYIKEADHSGRITWIFFDPNYAGRGLGSKAVKFCLAKMKNDKRIQKLVVTTSQYAYRFFEKFGYQLIRTEKNYWGKGLDLYEMEMKNQLD